MSESFYPKGLKFKHRGYFAAPIDKDDSKFKGDSEHELWLQWKDSLNGAKTGDFSKIPQLIKVYKGTNNWVLARSCADLLGDAANTACFQQMILEMKNIDDEIMRLMMKLEFCGALASWGSLSIIPVLLETFIDIRIFNDSDIIPVYISNLLEGAIPDPTPNSIDIYRAEVMERYNQLNRKFGTDKTVVFHGEVFSVTRLARFLLKRLSERRYIVGLRQRFEASTGIDCSNFYEDGNVQTLKAMAIVEEFLESPEAEKYEEGVRYFFGHRIPD